MKRRHVLGAVGAMLGLSLMPIAPSMAGGKRRNLVFVILRGGMDGLAAVPCVADPAYVSARQKLALDPSSLLQLDGTFALHPAMRSIHPWFKSGELSFVQATGLAYRKRSHFDAQDLLENGAIKPGSLHTGWLNRALTQGNTGQALALGNTVPLVLRGEYSATAIDPLRRKDAKAGLVDLLEDMLESDPLLSTAFSQGLESRERVKMAQVDDGGQRKTNRRKRFTESIGVLGRMMALEQRSQVAVLEFSGWDTHANQGTLKGTFANRLEQLSEGLYALRQAMGPSWSDTVVMVASEFGRTVRPNGTGGTDHGTGGLVMLAGGGVSGGRVHADWPGLRENQLFQGRDLATTIDIRRVFKGVLRDHMGIDRSDLDRVVFPQSRDAQALQGLIRTS